MSFAGVTKGVRKIQNSITYWLSTILIRFFHSWKNDEKSAFIYPFIPNC